MNPDRRSVSSIPKKDVRPSRRGGHFSADLARDAQAHFQKQSIGEVSEVEARAMLADLTDFFRILIEWDSKRRAKPGLSIPKSRKKE